MINSILKVVRGCVQIGGFDLISNFRKVQTKVRADGLVALVTDATVVVESTFGADSSPDTFFIIRETGGAGTTWTIDIAATVNDPTVPDRDALVFSKVFTVVAGEVGDEIKFRDRIIKELNLDSGFKDDSFFKAQPATDRAIVHIFSTKFSLSGEFWERPLAGDFDVTIGGAPGDGVVVVGFDNIISRAKPVSIFRDIDNPHKLGSFSIFGNVRVEAKALSDIFVQEATDDGTPTGDPEMTVDGSGTAVDFTINASATTDIFIEDLIFDGQGNGIKYGNFLSQNMPLTNGVEVTIKSDNIVTTFSLIKSTEDFKNKFAALSGDGANFDVDPQAGKDEMLAILNFANPFIIKVTGTHGVGNDDFIRVRIQDDLSSGISRFNFRVKGFEKDP